MPLQNRVTPFGEIVAVPERGTMKGNRGILHNGQQQVRRRWAGKLWICCTLEFQGRRDPVMAPGHYTRLFFLDEPTALAAGHRPCAYCRRGEYTAFKAAWAVGNASLGLGPAPLAVEIDAVLHRERLGPHGAKRLHPANLEDLPDGAFFTPDDGPQPAGQMTADPADSGDRQRQPPQLSGSAAPERSAFLLWGGSVWRWSLAGYRLDGPARPGPVLLLTPPSLVAALANGYRPRPPAGLS